MSLLKLWKAPAGRLAVDLVLCGGASIAGAGGPTYTVLHDFGDDRGQPYSRLVEDADGRFCGTTLSGGRYGAGSVFALTPNGGGWDFSTLHSFEVSPFGQVPWGDLALGGDGYLYGTTAGLVAGSAGTVFKLSTDGGTFAFLHVFDRTDGQDPRCGVVAADNFLYGTTTQGGSLGGGTIFRLGIDGSAFVVLHELDPFSEGSSPAATLARGPNGVLYGTTDGSVFRIGSNGSGFAVLHQFSFEGEGSPAEIIMGQDGFLYGFARMGGPSGAGSLFKMGTDGSMFAVIRAFQPFTDGGEPASLVQAADGTVYGSLSTFAGQLGNVFSVSPDGGGFLVLHGLEITSDGAFPRGLILGHDGRLYGVAEGGGALGPAGAQPWGTVFGLDTDGAGWAVLHSFWRSGDGVTPVGELILGGDGFLYGTTSYGGSTDGGTVFKVRVDGFSYEVLHNFAAGPGTGSYARLLHGADGMLYGTTAGGGGGSGPGLGTAFRMAPDGSAYSTIHAFLGIDGASPGELIQGKDGKLYGVTEAGGAANAGTVFRVAKDGSAFASIHSFVAGGFPFGGLTQGSDGFLYGSTLFGGASADGSVFRLSTDGARFATIASFSYTVQGSRPLGRLVEDRDGLFYGVTSQGGPPQAGTVFRVARDGSVFERAYSLDTQSPFPSGGLSKGDDGSFFGVRNLGGKGGTGFIFRLDLNQTATEAVVPMVDCVIDNGNGRFTAYFRYLNRNAEDVTIPIGWSNRLLPASVGRPQPEQFAPGRSPLYPSSAFAVASSGAALSWTLKGPDGQTRIVAATVNSRRCAGPPRTTPASQTTAGVGSPPRARQPQTD